MLLPIIGLISVLGLLGLIWELRQIGRLKLRQVHVTRLLLSLIVVVYGGWFFYVGPRQTAEHYLDAMLSFNATTIRETACDGSTLSRQADVADSTGKLFAGVLGGVIASSWNVRDEFFIPLANQLNFTLSMSNVIGGGSTERAASLLVKNAGIGSFCVDSLSIEILK